MAGAQDYELEFSSINLDGQTCQTTDYEILDAVLVQGVTAEVQTSTDYTALPLLALPVEPASAVHDWMLF